MVKNQIHFQLQKKTKAVSIYFRAVFGGILGPIALLIILVIIVNIIQKYKPNYLPKVLQTWIWLPRPLRSLSWYDQHIFSK